MAAQANQLQETKQLDLNQMHLDTIKELSKTS